MATYSPIARVCGVALAIAVGTALSPGRAAAECGDYVHIVRETDGPPPDAGGGRDTPRKPCDGPNCSGKPSAPATPTGAPATWPTHSKSPAVGTAEVAGPAAARGWGHPAEPVWPIVGHANPVFHPPRA